MREILFRGFFKDENEDKKIFFNGEWIKGKWVYGGTWKNARGQRFITEDNGWNGFSVIPETVGQFTGRVAEEEKKIFEGDKCILTTFDHNGHDYQHEVVIEYLGGAFYFVNDEKEFYMCVAEVEDTESDVEIIGNIHDTDLLKGESAE